MDEERSLTRPPYGKKMGRARSYFNFLSYYLKVEMKWR